MRVILKVSIQIIGYFLYKLYELKFFLHIGITFKIKHSNNFGEWSRPLPNGQKHHLYWDKNVKKSLLFSSL